MNGAILGDLAAWTWEQDKDLFFRKLVSSEASPSKMMKEMLLMADTLAQVRGSDIKVHESLGMRISPEATVLRAIAIGWLYDTEAETASAYQEYGFTYDKEDWYAGAFMWKLIFALRHGASKKDALMVENVSSFKGFVEDISWNEQSSILGVLIRAWGAFYSSYDFGSALHRAMELPGDRHLNGILVGALADAMYGCDRYMVKAKYGKGCSLTGLVNVPSRFQALYRAGRTFFAKNSAMTNVERHVWKDVANPYVDKIISRELRRRILKAFQPTFDDRYGFYLDDGYIYVYRSCRVLNRFKLSSMSDGPFRIVELQASEEAGYQLGAIQEALYSVEYRWNRVSDDYAIDRLPGSDSLLQPFFGVSPLRMGIDGKGVTTLVTFMGCQLRCKYCLNERCHGAVYEDDGITPGKGILILSPQQLYDRVKKDNIYFQATGGGVCFGGGEPLEHPEFIMEFRKLCGTRWKITVETALACHPHNIELLAPIVDHWIVDIKDMNPRIREKYTGRVGDSAHQLCYLKQYGIVDNVTIRVPHIPGFNTDEDVKRSIEQVKILGFKDIQEFEYLVLNRK
ncbi:radical SAM protein [Segatella copri]|nr:radical SAM protein [Segatella copri]